VARVKIEVGDIVKHEGAPCEVFTTFIVQKRQYIYLVNKITLVGAFLFADEVEFVRRPSVNPVPEKRK
jgi:hypothetical protein